MSDPVVGITSGVLKWARERSGVSLEDVAAKLKKPIELVRGWEEGTSAPTYSQLETLAYQIYKRPLALFFFPEPPDEPDPRQEFRTLPDLEVKDLSPETRYRIRQAMAMQESLREVHDRINPSERKIFRDVTIDRFSSAETDAVAATVRKYLGVTLDTQKAWKSVEQAIREWREAVENVGVFVFKDTFSQKDFWGFSLDDPEFPVIYINNSTKGKSRQIFTLFHELAHLIVHSSGVTKENDTYIDRLSGTPRRLEVFCNRFAGYFLVPSRDLLREMAGTSDEEVERLAGTYRVSREMILRRLLDLQRISQQRFERSVSRLREEYESLPIQGSGGNYYATKRTYLSSRFLDAAFGQYYQGRISVQQLADHLGVKVSSVPGIETLHLQQTIG
jgi:Zn-dependent peptidase ImmA (M78 family)/transcriptional regulator with XRE-family HTH domain